MGSKHSKQSSPHHQKPKRTCDGLDKYPSSIGSSILSSFDLHFMRSKKAKKTKKTKKFHVKEKRRTRLNHCPIPRKLTLEDWILTSPNNNMKVDGIQQEGELFVFKHYKKIKRFPSTPKTRRKGFSLEKLVMLDRQAESFVDCSSMATVSSSVRVSKKKKLEKRVCFKSPKETDILLFYSP